MFFLCTHLNKIYLCSVLRLDTHPIPINSEIKQLLQIILYPVGCHHAQRLGLI